ncbi:MAG: hypothetical protein HeimC3_02640 [Candidatus Heimdallarchaeota archaeon LC_3]|nr:MAG: hypothetical protein HeimC3_02640 [Candidatus Heimdallarchaeota archaeon LC_3]
MNKKTNEENLETNYRLAVENKIFTSGIRFSIMIILLQHSEISLNNLQKLLKITPGNLDHHLKQLEQHKLIKKNSKIFKTRFLVHITITEEGKRDFKEYINKIKNIIQEI